MPENGQHPPLDGVEADFYGGYNLAAIVGRVSGGRDQPDRVVSFWVYDDRPTVLGVSEECDQFFGVDLNADQLERLIDWLGKRLTAMRAVS